MNLLGHFLVSQPQCQDPYFHHATVLICRHTPEGAWGLITNRPIESQDRATYIKASLGLEHLDCSIWEGGPVDQDRVIVLHTDDWQGPHSQCLTRGLWVSQDRSVIQELSLGNLRPRRFKIIMGCAAWAAGQLEGELEGRPPWRPDQQWLITPASAVTVLDHGQSLDQWQRAVRASAQTWADHHFQI